MKARLIKEARDLLPMFAGALLLVVAPFFIGHHGVYSMGVFPYMLGCVVLAGSSFGNEFQHRTFSLLLALPIERSVLWRDKMLVLGADMLISLVALLACLQVHPFAHVLGQWPLALATLCAFCGAPYWTLLLRQGIGGMAFTAAVPTCLLLANALVTERLFDNTTVAPYSAAALLLIYCALVYCLGYAKFQRLQVVDGASRELALPIGLEAIFIGPLTRISARFRGQFVSLLRKEFRLQQICFLLAGLFVLIALTGACLIRFQSEWGRNVLGGDYIIYVIILPLIAGAVSVAEEKGWDLAEWHLTLPPSALKQWSAKMLVALSTSFVLGLVLPAILLLAGDALFGRGDALSSLPPASQVLCWVLGQLLLTSVAVYAASFSSTTLKAILGAFAIIIAGWAVCWSLVVWAARAGVYYGGKVRSTPQAEQEHILLLLAGGLLLVFCLVQGLSYLNFRRFRLPADVLIAQLAIILLCVGVGTLLTMLLVTPVVHYRVILFCAGLGSVAGISSAYLLRSARRRSLPHRVRAILLCVGIVTLVWVLSAVINWYGHPTFIPKTQPLWRWMP